MTGFVATLLVSPLITLIQNQGNRILGMTIYAQQIVSGISVVFSIIVVMFVRFNMIKEKD